MSPSESDLRAALHDGEGDGTTIDVERIVAGGVAARARRRSLLATVAGAVVFVGAAGTIGAVVLDNNDPSGSNVGNGNLGVNSAAAASRGADRAGSTVPAPSASSASRSNEVAPPAGGTTSTPTDCPASFPLRLLPGGGSSGQFGAGGRLFPSPAVTMIVCSYGNSLAGSARPGRLVLSGSNSTSLQNSLESASKTSVAKPCPTIRTGAGRRLAFIGIDSAGAAMRVVTATLTDPACNVKVTNGTSVRFDWQPPAGLRQVLLALEPGPGPITPLPSHSPSGANHGSPVR